jgi:putative nucleotidyltransferase with HDIG domain
LAAHNRILVISDDTILAKYLEEKLALEKGYRVIFEYSAQAGLSSLSQDSFDLVIMKSGMPDMDQAELCKGLKKVDPDCVVIMISDGSVSGQGSAAFDPGIYESLVQPISPERLFFLVRKGIELRLELSADRKLIQSLKEQNDALQKQNILLAKRIEESTRNLTRLYEDLRSTYMRTIRTLAQAIDARDHYTHSHSQNVANYAVVIAREMELSAKEIEILREACELHDLGKIGIEDSILNKPSSLTQDEWAQVKLHPITGAQILEPLTFLNDVIDLVRQHHEHYDGSGYPEGRKGQDILLSARIIHLADAYESMRSARSYRKQPFTKEEAVAEIKRNNGTQFDPQVVDAFMKIVEEL